MSGLGVAFFLVVVVAVAWLVGMLVDRLRARATLQRKPAAPRPRTTNYPRLVLTATFLAFASTGLYPPWNYTYRFGEHAASVTRPGPRGWIGAPPEPQSPSGPKYTSGRDGVALAGGRLAVEWLVIAALGAAGYVLARRTPVEWTGSVGTGPEKRST